MVCSHLTDPGQLARGDAWNGYGTRTRACATTERKSQGATTSAVIWYADTCRGRVHRNSFYVAATRARHDVYVFTDDRERLRELVRHPREKTSPLDHLDDRIERAFAAWRDRGRDFRREGLRPGGPASTEPRTRETEDVKPPRVRERDRELERSR